MILGGIITAFIIDDLLPKIKRKKNIFLIYDFILLLLFSYNVTLIYNSGSFTESPVIIT